MIIMKITKVAKTVYRQMPANRDLSQQIPDPGQKLGPKSPRAGTNFKCKSTGVHGEGMVTAKIDSCIILRNQVGCHKVMSYHIIIKPFQIYQTFAQYVFFFIVLLLLLLTDYILIAYHLLSYDWKSLICQSILPTT